MGSMNEQRFRILDGFTLKWIAIASMIIDHFGSIIMDGVLAPYRVDGVIYFTSDMPWFIRSAPMIKEVCEALGSVAFPIFCFLLVEGFLHTSNRLRYGLRIGLFALLSEIPFNLAHSNTIWHPSLQNVLFTLCVGVFTLYAIAWSQERLAARRAACVLSVIGITLAGAGLAFLIRSEYVFLGILCIVLLYVLRANRYWQLAGFAPLLIVSPWILLAVPPVTVYNGQRGHGSQYFFYVFYPVHFLVFTGIASLLAQR